jgi:hypothetical protein
MTPGARTVTITSSSPGARVNRVRLREDQTDGQLVREYQVTAAQIYLNCFMAHAHALSRDPHHTAVSVIDYHLIYQLLLLLLILPNTDSALQSQRVPSESSHHFCCRHSIGDHTRNIAHANTLTGHVTHATLPMQTHSLAMSHTQHCPCKHTH